MIYETDVINFLQLESFVWKCKLPDHILCYLHICWTPTVLQTNLSGTIPGRGRDFLFS